MVEVAEEIEIPEEEEVDEEAEDEEAEDEAVRKMGIAFSPDAIIMFPLAIILDFVGLILICFGLDDCGITDIIGLIFIGSWSFFHSQTIQMTSGAKKTLAKGAKAAGRIKWLRPLFIAGEFIPYVGAAPCWTILVWFELQS